MDAMIEVQNLRKSFGTLVAVSDVSFSLNRGEVLGFLGPNGAGKSTAMKMITGFLAPTGGQIKVCGHNVADQPLEVKTAIGYLPEGAPAYGDMTPQSFLEFIADMRNIKGQQKRKAVDDAVAKTNLNSVLHKPIEILSKGFKRRVGLAQAILHDPKVLILDEPTDGLDPNQKHEVRELLKVMAKDKAIIISTHILEEVEALCSRAIIISQGEVLFDGTPTELESLAPDRNSVTLTLLDADTDAERRSISGQLQNLNNVLSVRSGAANEEKNGDVQFIITPKNGSTIINEVANLSRAENWKIKTVHINPVQLDEVFRQVTLPSGDSEQEVLT
jgi:ABC-2 type transport system ATP-binding protein